MYKQRDIPTSKRQDNTIELIAMKTILRQLWICGSFLQTNMLSYPKILQWLPNYDEVELAIKTAIKLFNSNYANVQTTRC